VPDIYIRRARVETKALDEKFVYTELSALKDEIVQAEQFAQIKDERIRRLEESIQHLQTDLNALSRVLKLAPTAREIEEASGKKKAS